MSYYGGKQRTGKIIAKIIQENSDNKDLTTIKNKD